MINLARPSIASLHITAMVNGLPLATATGFVVEHDAKKFLISNRHVVRGRDNDTDVAMHNLGGLPDTLVILHNVLGELGRWHGHGETLFDEDSKPKWFVHPKHRGEVDVIALPLTDLENVDVYSHDPWATGPQLAVGVSRPLFIVGFPFGITGGGATAVWVQGTMATEFDLDHENLPSFLIDSRTRKGQSGSPVIAYSARGTAVMDNGDVRVGTDNIERFVGVYSGRINEESDLGIVWKASVVREIVEGGLRESK
jgi:hypothetical protein